MKFVFVLVIVASVVAASQSIPQGLSSSFNLLSATVSSLYGQVTTLAKNVALATGRPVQPLLLAGLALPANLLPTLASLPSGTLISVSSVLTSALNQITTVVTRAGTDLNRLEFAIRSVQTVLASTVNSLNALNVPALNGLMVALSSLSSTVGMAVSQITG